MSATSHTRQTLTKRLQRAIELVLELWDIQTEFEAAAGCEIDGFSDRVEELAVGVPELEECRSNPDWLDPNDVSDVLDEWLVDEIAQTTCPAHT